MNHDITQLPDMDFRRWLADRLQVDRALDPGNSKTLYDELYEPLYEGTDRDAVALIFDDIELSVVESLNFLSGFRGAGKTTELFRLKKLLQDRGYPVLYANTLDFLLPSEPVEISNFLLVLAGAMSDAVEKALGKDLLHESFWARFVHYLSTTDIAVEGFDFKAEAKAGARHQSGKVALNFKTSLKETPSFRAALKSQLASRLGEVRGQVREFLEFAQTTVQDHFQTKTSVVFIFDQMEQLRDTIDTEGRVAESVAAIMANHREDFRIPHMHVVCTVPPWLKFKLPQMQKVRLIYNVKLWENDPDRTPHADGWNTAREFVRRRFTEPGLERFFKDLAPDGSSRLVNLLIQNSGGHFRDLLRMLREAVLRARTMPATIELIQQVIADIRASFLPIPADDAKWLHLIGVERDSLLPDRTIASLQRMTFFLDTHCALILRNGGEWYDVHPLIRAEVADIAARHAASSAAIAVQQG